MNAGSKVVKEPALAAHTSGDARASANRDAAPPSRRSFSAQVAGTLLVRMLMAANSVGTGVIVARWLGAEGLGVFAALNIIVATAVQIGSFGLPSASTYFVAQDRRNLKSVAVNALIFAVLGGGALAGVVALLAASGAALFVDLPPKLLMIAAAAIPFQLVTLLGLNIFLGLREVGRFNALDAAGQSLTLLNTVVTLVLAGAGLFALVALNTAASIVVSLAVAGFIYWAIRGHDDSGAKKSSPSATLFRRMAGYGLKFHVAMVASLLIFRADILIVKYFRGAAEAGVYSVAAQVGMLLMLLPGVISTLLFPRVASEHDVSGELTAMVTRHAAFVMLLIFLAAAPASFVLPVLYGAQFAETSVLLLILLPGVYLVGVESVMVQHFSGTGFPVAISLFWVGTLVINIALNVALVPDFGARAAAVASTVSYALIFVLVAAYFRVRTGHSFSTMLCLKADEMCGLLKLGRDGVAFASRSNRG